MKKTAENMTARHLIFLEKVFERRDILFKKGPTNNNNLHAKEEEWEQIRRECVDAGYFELKDKSFRHLRDITWQNFRRRAVAKLEMVRKGGKDVEQLTDSDKMVLAIIGNIQIPSLSQFSFNMPTQVILDNEQEEDSVEPQPSNELFNIKTEPIDLLPMINGQSFASFFDNRSNSNTTQSESNDEIVLENDHHRPSLTTRRPLFEDDDEPVVINNGQIAAPKKNTLKRKRILADLKYRDAETEKLLAEADKLRAEATLIRLQANELEFRIKRSASGQNTATAFITDGEQL